MARRGSGAGDGADFREDEILEAGLRGGGAAAGGDGGGVFSHTVGMAVHDVGSYGAGC